MKKVLSLLLVLVLMTGSVHCFAQEYVKTLDGSLYEADSAKFIYKDFKDYYICYDDICVLTHDNILLQSDKAEINFVPMLENVEKFSYHNDVFAAIKTDGTLWMWGTNYSNRITKDAKEVESPLFITDNVREVSLSGNVKLCIKNDGSLYSWGNKTYMGAGEEDTETPAFVMNDVDRVLLNDSYRVFVRKTDGTVWAWGEHGYPHVGKSNGYSYMGYVDHLLGTGEHEKGSFDKTVIQYTPARVLCDNICEIQYSNYKTKAKTDGGELYVWGDTYGNTPVKTADNVYRYGNTWTLLNDGTLKYGNETFTNVCDATSVQRGYDLNLEPYYDTHILCQDGKLYAIEVKPLRFGDGDTGYNKVLVDTDVKAIVGNSLAYIKNDNSLWLKGGYEPSFTNVKWAKYVNDAVDSRYYILDWENNYYAMTPNNKATKLLENVSVDEDEIISPPVIGVKVNGFLIETDTEPYIKNDRTMVPMRAIFEALGAEVTWDNDTRTAVGVMGGVEIKITIGENVLYKNGEAVELDVAAEITNDRTMVPVRAISEAFGCTVNWNDETKTVEITQN